MLIYAMDIDLIDSGIFKTVLQRRKVIQVDLRGRILFDQYSGVDYEFFLDLNRIIGWYSQYA